MPLTRAYLESVAETVDDFQIRRIKWAIQQLDNRGEEILVWKVIKIMGLREDCSEKVKDMVQREVCQKRN